MNRSVAILLGAVVVLGALAMYSTWEDARPAPKSLSIAGFATTAQLEAEKNRGMLDPREEIPSPVDEILIERAGETIHLKRTGSGKDSTWALLKPVTAQATRFQVNKMVNLFKAPTRSIYSTTASDAELSLYDLEPARRISVTLKAGGEVWEGASLVIGKVAKSESETSEQGAKNDTWVMRASEPGTVYRVAGKDLRSAFEVQFTDLRDKAIFGLKAEDLVRREGTSPDGTVIVLSGRPTVAPAAPEGARVTPAKTLWSLTKPAGYEADDSVSSLARSFAGVRTREFVDPKDAPKDVLTGKVWKLKGTTADGESAELTVADEDGDQVFARASGVAELLKIDRYTAKNLKKRLADVRHRGVIEVDAGAIESLTFAPEGEKPYGVKKGASGWSYTKGKGRADIESLLKGLTTIKASRYARPAEMDIARAQLAKPEFKAVIVTAAGKTTLAAGTRIEAKPNKGQRWAVITSSGETGDPFLIQDHMVKRFRKGRSEIAWKKLFDGKVDAIDRVTLLVPGEAPLELVRPEGPGALRLASVPEGKKPRATLVSGIGSTLASARAKAFHPDKKARDVGLGIATNLRVNFHSAAGEQTLEVSDQKDGNDPYVLVTGGPLDGQVITLASYQVAKLRKTMADLTE
jgi:hypothetical protein